MTPGAKPIMYFVITALVNPGDEVIYPNPGFPIYESVINFVGGVRWSRFPLREEIGFGFDLDAARAEGVGAGPGSSSSTPRRTRPAACWTATSSAASRRSAKTQYRIPVLTDEIYKSFLYEGEFASITALSRHEGPRHHPGRLLEVLCA